MTFRSFGILLYSDGELYEIVIISRRRQVIENNVLVYGFADG